MRKKILFIISIFILNGIAKAQSVFIYGQVEEDQIDSLSEMITGIFRDPSNNQVKKLNVFFLDYHKQTTSKWKPSLVVVKRYNTYRSDLKRYYNQHISGADLIPFSRKEFLQLKEDILEKNPKSYLAILDKCGVIAKTKNADYKVYKRIMRDENYEPGLTSDIKKLKKSFLISFYEPSIRYSNFMLDNDSLDLSGTEANVSVGSSNIRLKGNVQTFNSVLKKFSMAINNQPEVQMNIGKNVGSYDLVKNITLNEGENTVVLMAEYADTMIKKTIHINLLGENAVDITYPITMKKHHICTDNTDKKESYFLLQFQTELDPTKLILHMSEKKATGESNEMQIPMSDLTPVSIKNLPYKGNLKAYCYKLNTRTNFSSFFVSGYSACGWYATMPVMGPDGKEVFEDIDNRYNVYFTLEKNPTQYLSKKIQDFRVSDVGDRHTDKYGNIIERSPCSCD